MYRYYIYNMTCIYIRDDNVIFQQRSRTLGHLDEVVVRDLAAHCLALEHDELIALLKAYCASRIPRERPILLHYDVPAWVLLRRCAAFREIKLCEVHLRRVLSTFNHNLKCFVRISVPKGDWSPIGALVSPTRTCVPSCSGSEVLGMLPSLSRSRAVHLSPKGT